MHLNLVRGATNSQVRFLGIPSRSPRSPSGEPISPQSVAIACGMAHSQKQAETEHLSAPAPPRDRLGSLRQFDGATTSILPRFHRLADRAFSVRGLPGVYAMPNIKCTLPACRSWHSQETKKPPAAGLHRGVVLWESTIKSQGYFPQFLRSPQDLLDKSRVNRTEFTQSSAGRECDCETEHRRAATDDKYRLDLASHCLVGLPNAYHGRKPWVDARAVFYPADSLLSMFSPFPFLDRAMRERRF